MSSIDTGTLVEANHLLSASIHAMDSYLAGTVRSTETDVKQLSDLACHALLLAGMISRYSGRSLDELSAVPLAQFPAVIRQLGGVSGGKVITA